MRNGADSALIQHAFAILSVVMKKSKNPSLPVGTTSGTPLPATSSDEAVRLLAYQLWEASGQPEGGELNFWLDAEVKLRTGVTSEKQPVADMPETPPAEG
jgi:hypothetical protein